MSRLFTLLSLFFFAPLFVLAVSVSEDTTLVLPSDSTSYTLVSGSSFNSLTVQSGAFEFAMSASQSITITSADKKNLTNNFQTDTTCESSQSKLVITLGSGALPQTISVTPTGTCSAAAASGGGGGGGTIYTNPEEGNPPAPIVAAKPPPPPAPITPAPEVAQPSPVAQVVSPVFNRNLTLGSRGDDVKALQEFLAKDPKLYPEGLVTSYFGGLTKVAVQRFQEKHGIAKAGVPGYGQVGPKTRTKLNELSGAAAPAVTVPVAAPAAPVALPAAVEFSRGLGLGARGDDVTQLQALLSGDKELYPEGIVSGYFGRLTEDAVKRFQEKYGIAGPGVPGYGFIGPKTRAKLNELMEVPASAAPSAAPSSADEQAQIQALQAQLRLLQEQLQQLQPSQ